VSVISLSSGREYSVEQLLEIVDDLRADVEAGNIIAFAAVGIQPDNLTARWTGAARVVPPLLMIGAIAKLQHFYIAENESD